MRGPRAAAVVLVAALGLLGTACGGDAAADPASDTPTPGSQETTAPSPEAEVEAAYLAYWDMLDRLAQAPDPDDPEIPQRASGEALMEVVAGLTTLHTRGQVSQTGALYAHSVEFVELEGDEAVLRDCVIDDGTIVDQATGEVVDGGEVAAKLLEVSLIVHSGHWKVNRVDRISTMAGAISCEDEPDG